MRVLAVDYGERRVGLAISDALEITANPLTVLERKRGAGVEVVLEAIARIVREEGVDEVVVGLPINIDGTHGPAAQGAQAFADALAARVSVPVRTFDERLTTVEADEMLGTGRSARARRRQVIDKLAATVILRDYLGSRPRPDA